MKHFTLEIKARGSLLVGGGESPEGLHASHLSDAQGRPYVPASALRGALRETLEVLLRGADQPACDGGRGHAVDTNAERWRPCEIDTGKPCLACRMFGGARNVLAEGQRDFSSLVLGDGTCADDDAWMIRPGVAVTRSARSAADNRLYIRRSTKTAACFVATGWLRDDEHANTLEAVTAATTHLGSGRSRGLARVDLSLRWIDAPIVADATLTSRDVRVRVTLRAPTTLGVPLAHENLRETRREIPGAALRGAIGFALAHTLERPDQDERFAALVQTDHEAPRFGFLTPRDDNATESDHGMLPLTLQRCKVAPGEHGDHDDLFDRIAITLLDRHTLVGGVHEHLSASHCRVCKRPLRGAHGYRGRSTPVPTQVATRASLERRGQSVREGALFTEVMLAPGTVFEGMLRNVPDNVRALLAKVPGLPVSIGRARGAGRGRVDLELSDAPQHAPLSQRAERFTNALQRRLQESGLSDIRAERLVPITFLSPVVFDPGGEPTDEAWSALLRTKGVRCVLRARRFVREGTWDQRGQGGNLIALQAAMGGSVYVLQLAEGQSWRDCVDALAELEHKGIGQRTYQGYGELVVFDPIHITQKVG